MRSRRRFLRDMAWGLPCAWLYPSLLLGCRKQESIFAPDIWKGDLAIVGGGVAGLHAAAMALEYGANVTIYEADKQVGGRVRSQGPSILPNQVLSSGFSKQPIELGPEFLIDPNSAFYQYIRSHVGEIKNYKTQEEHFIDEQLLKDTALKQHVIYQTYEKLRRDALLRSQQKDPNGDPLNLPDVPLARYLSDAAASADLTQEEIFQHRAAIRVFESELNAHYHLKTQHVSVNQFAQLMAQPKRDRTRSYLTNYTLSSVVRYSYLFLEKHTKLNANIRTIEYAGNRVILTDKRNTRYEADKVLITVPVDVLSRIRFSPALPADKQSVLAQSKLLPCTKIFLKFSEILWEPTSAFLYFPSQYTHALVHPSAPILTLYAYGADSDLLRTSGTAAKNFALRLLDEIFNGRASRHFEDAEVVHWTTDRNLGISTYIQGAFSHVPADPLNAREVLADSVNNKLFFAGEATHTGGLANTLHGAVETAKRAIYEILKDA